MKAMRGALLGGLLAASLSLSGCALMIGNDLGSKSWDDQYSSDFKDQSDSDRALSRKVQGALNQDGETRRAGIRVRSKEGKVLLLGRTGDPAVASHAMRVALGVEGVEQVTSRIELIGSH